MNRIRNIDLSGYVVAVLVCFMMGWPMSSAVGQEQGQYGYRFLKSRETTKMQRKMNAYPGDWVDTPLTLTRFPSGLPTDGRRFYNPSGGFLEFFYDLGPYGQAPEDPAEVLQTAIEAYHRGGFPGRYELVTVGEYFHIVPTARRDEGGVWEPIQSPLDTIVSLDGRGRITEKS